MAERKPLRATRDLHGLLCLREVLQRACLVRGVGLALRRPRTRESCAARVRASRQQRAARRRVALRLSAVDMLEGANNAFASQTEAAYTTRPRRRHSGDRSLTAVSRVLRAALREASGRARSTYTRGERDLTSTRRGRNVGRPLHKRALGTRLRNGSLSRTVRMTLRRLPPPVVCATDVRCSIHA